MQYSEIKSTFTGILNRRDITASQITTFIQLGIQYVQRKLRVPPMEKTMEYTCDGTKNVPIPGDFLELIAIYSDDTSNNNKLEKRDLQTTIRAAQGVGSPTMFHRNGTNLMIAPVPPEGTIIYVNYYSDATALSADTDTNWMTDAAPVLMIYGALRYASDYFLDDRKAVFAETFAEELFDIQEMANRDELVAGTMSPLYHDQINAL